MKAKKISRSTPVAKPAAPSPPTREQIQALSHAIWIDRGCPEGCDVEIWLEAERQLQGRVRPLPESESVDVDTSPAARIDEELERVVSPPGSRSPTSL